MKNAITFIRFFRKKEAGQLENRLNLHAQVTGYKVVWQERQHVIAPKQPVNEIILNTMNGLRSRGIKVDAIIVVRYSHIHREFTQTAKLIKNLRHYGVRIISIEETVDENDPLFTEIYYPAQL